MAAAAAGGARAPTRRPSSPDTVRVLAKGLAIDDKTTAILFESAGFMPDLPVVFLDDASLSHMISDAVGIPLSMPSGGNQRLFYALTQPLSSVCLSTVSLEMTNISAMSRAEQHECNFPNADFAVLPWRFTQHTLSRA